MRRFACTAITTFCVSSLFAPPAYACGGFFCSSAPVDQAGESIVYGLESHGTLTMAVQIRYSGDDDDFAWILPVPAAPEITLGTDALFDQLRAASQPMFVAERATEGTCRSHPRCVYSDGSTAYTGGCGFSSGPTPWAGGYVDAAAPVPPPTTNPDAGPVDPGVTVISQGPVGSYDTVVLGSTSATEVVRWLGENDYDIPESSIPLLQAYEGSRQVFVALRLSSNPETRQIRPIVLHMATDEACLPIRLTAIATVPDMPITAFFLGRSRVVPSNYSSADIDTIDPGFWRATRRWEDAVSAAVDELDGQAFATDYAGPTPALSLELPSVSDLASERDVSSFVRALSSRGYAGDAVLLDLFRSHLQPPPGVELTTYVNCVFGAGRGCGEPSSFDPAGLAAAIEVQVTIPRREAHALVHRHGYLTRLFTTMSAEDMTIDPVFVEDEGSPPSSNVHVARLVTSCDQQHYPEDAAQRWDIAGSSFPERAAGALADDEAYCRSFGAYTEATVPRRTTRSGGCVAGADGAGAIQWGALGLIVLLFLARRRRHN